MDGIEGLASRLKRPASGEEDAEGLEEIDSTQYREFTEALREELDIEKPELEGLARTPEGIIAEWTSGERKQLDGFSRRHVGREIGRLSEKLPKILHFQAPKAAGE